MKYLFQKEIRCVILTSGTLAPLEPLISAMEIPSPLRLSNPHIIQPDQVFVRMIDTGVGNVKLNFNYYNR